MPGDEDGWPDGCEGGCTQPGGCMAEPEADPGCPDECGCMDVSSDDWQPYPRDLAGIGCDPEYWPEYQRPPGCPPWHEPPHDPPCSPPGVSASACRMHVQPDCGRIGKSRSGPRNCVPAPAFLRFAADNGAGPCQGP